MAEDEKDWEDVPQKKAPTSSDEWTDVSAKPAMKPGAIQMSKGGKVFPNALEAVKSQQKTDKDDATAWEEAIGRAMPSGQLGVGATKGLLSTGRNLGGLGIKAVRYLAPEFGNKLAESWPGAVNGAPEMMKPQTPLSKTGFIGEQVGEFAVPGGAVAKGAKAAEAGIDAAKLAPVASKALKLLSRGGLEAASSAGVTAAQGGSGKDIGINAGISAALPPVGAALKPAFTALAEKAAPALANKLLRPVPTQIKNAIRFGRNPGQALSDEGIVATSHGDLVSRISDRKEDVGNQIGSMLKGATNAKPIDAAAIINKHIDGAIQDVLNGKTEGGQALVDGLEELRNQLTQNRHLVEGKVTNLAPKNLNLTPSEAHALKRQVGDSAKWRGQAFDDEMNQVKRGIYRDLNSGVQKSVPGVKALQDRYGNLLEAEEAAQHEYARHESRNPFGLLDAITGASGAAIGAAHGGTKEAALLGLALPAARKAMQSPLAQTVGVQGLKNAPKLISPEFLKWARNAAFGAQSEGRQ